MRHFIARRGGPKTIYSENGANFKRSCNKLSKLDRNQIQEEANLERMSWKFNSTSPHSQLVGWLVQFLRSNCDVLWEIQCCLLKNLKLLFGDVNLLLIQEL
ncbi:uncharacterized protein TNIN_201211 [Trichonephila inaurata madagascariensis]|uniref:Integrase catalytic domain-containing protein n=1 Tax=Trichonephila inaurata madagascariensis TaxID=2747483 RepID=A0A8X6X2N5_9ARAC|nr:uncharacterized protein TNIN_201211 [Trichonephila inaurata madagascariensis]